MPFHLRLGTAAGEVAESGYGREGDAARFGGTQDALGDGMLGLTFQGRCQAQAASDSSRSPSGMHVGNAEAPFGQRSGLVEYDRLQIREPARRRPGRGSAGRCSPTRLVLTATTSGTASPSACGQAMTITVTARSIANARSRPSPSQTTKVSEPAAQGNDGQPQRRPVGQFLACGSVIPGLAAPCSITWDR